jgi:hypothetical protein
VDLRDIRRQPFVRDLTRTRHMTAVSAVVLATIFMPLLGLPNVDELRVFQGAVEDVSDARANALAARRDDEAARERMLRSVIGERDEGGASIGFVDRVLTVVRPARQSEDTLDTANIMPLPPIEEDADLVEPIEDEEAVLPDVEEPDMAGPDDEYYEEESRVLEEEEEF